MIGPWVDYLKTMQRVGNLLAFVQEALYADGTLPKGSI